MKVLCSLIRRLGMCFAAWLVWGAVDQSGTRRIGEARLPGPQGGGFDDLEGWSAEEEEGDEEWRRTHGSLKTRQEEHQEPPPEPPPEDEWMCEGGMPKGPEEHETEGKEQEGAASQEEGWVREVAGFIETSAFHGAREGYVFKLGDQGVGYYRDEPKEADGSGQSVAAKGARCQPMQRPTRLKLAELILGKEKESSWYHTAGVRADGEHLRSTCREKHSHWRSRRRMERRAARWKTTYVTQWHTYCYFTKQG